MRILALFCLLVKFSHQENCCEDIYDRKHFFIANPGFPSNSTDTECEYKIRKANDNICRLRLTFHFYRNGVQKTNGCSGGYLEIDGKQICGCRSGLRLISKFSETSQDHFKVIKYKSEGNSNGISGFAVEVHQDDCLKRYQNHRYWPSLIGYYHDNFYKYWNDEDDDEDQYEDTLNFNPLIYPENNKLCYITRSRLHRLSWYEHLPSCSKNCIIFDSVKGDFQSDGYPFWYYNNVNKCYRFLQKPGYCSINFYINDFSLQYSYNCCKDYLKFENNNYGYCGYQLCNKILSFNFDKPHVDFRFVTDHCFHGRGFSGSYEQQVCVDTTTTHRPSTSTELTTETTTRKTTETPLTTTTESIQECGGLLTAQRFTLEAYGNQNFTCSFTIRKFDSGVCMLDMNFTDFDLSCNNHRLTLDNGEELCRYKTGEKYSIPFKNQEINIIYRRNIILDDSRIFKIDFVQNNFSCSPDLEPEPF